MSLDKVTGLVGPADRTGPGEGAAAGGPPDLPFRDRLRAILDGPNRGIIPPPATAATALGGKRDPAAGPLPPEWAEAASRYRGRCPDCGRPIDVRWAHCRDCWDASPAKSALARRAGAAARAFAPRRPRENRPVVHLPTGRVFGSLAEAAAAEDVGKTAILKRLRKPWTGWAYGGPPPDEEGET